MRTSRKYRMWRVWVAAAVALTAAGPAPAFYWCVKPRASIILPADEELPGNPPSPGAEPTPLPGGQLPSPNPGGPEPPAGGVPEPATGVVGLIGLAAVAARRWVRKK